MAILPSGKETGKYRARRIVFAYGPPAREVEQESGPPVPLQKIAESLAPECRSLQKSSLIPVPLAQGFAAHPECRKSPADRAMCRHTATAACRRRDIPEELRTAARPRLECTRHGRYPDCI